MEERTRVAVHAAASIPFNCVICFDEFNSKNRPPVVLPCGHTYVCLDCSKRLNRCMECREPLFAPSSSVSEPSLAGYKTVHLKSMNDATLRTNKLRLPTPRNTVLLALIEATEMQQKQTRTEEGDQEDVDLDLNRIVLSLATLTGPCGTYVVRKEGLSVEQSEPRDKGASQGLVEGSKSFEESCHIESTLSKEDHTFDRELCALRVGQKVQVVSFCNGVATLARNQGYIRANSSQIVKVGQPSDECCRLEGLVRTVVARGEDLENELKSNRRVEEHIRKKIETAKKVDPTFPIVSDPVAPDVQSPIDENDVHEPLTPRSDASGLTQPILQTPESFLKLGLSRFIDVDPNLNAIPSLHHQHSIRSDSPASIDNSDIAAGSHLPTLRRSASHEHFHDISLGCGTTLFGESLAGSLPYLERDENDSLHNPIALARIKSALEYSQSQPSCVTPTQTSSFDHVDFRTGLSGHGGLNIARRSPAPRCASIRMMSEHRGIARQRPSSRNSQYPHCPVLSSAQCVQGETP